MAEVNNSHNAEDSYVGYIFQGQYALLVLFDAEAEEKISVETADDVVLQNINDIPVLHQIKHTLSSKPGSLTLKNSGFLNTLGIWATHADSHKASFVFVTCADVGSKNVLSCLCKGNNKSGDDATLDTLANDIFNEAQRVVDERLAAKTKGNSLPYKDKASSCEVILSIGKESLVSLLERVIILDGSCNAFDINVAVEDKLKMHVPLERRGPIAERIMEWWERRVAKSLINKERNQDVAEISKQELLNRINQLIIECSEDNLPDDYSDLEPEQEDIDGLPEGFMEKQILLVNGNKSRVKRAAYSRWQARNQRHRWMAYDISLAEKLKSFDKNLCKEWEDKHTVISEELEADGLCDSELAKAGLSILDWTHDEAPFKLPQIKSSWRQPFIIRGSYQELSNVGKVGWHPLYKKHLSIE